MSLDLYQKETEQKLSSFTPVSDPEPSAFDGFARGTGMYAMQGFAKAGRAIDLLGSVGPIAQDAFTGGTEAQDRYFKEHDDVFQNAVDYWTPRPNEVGMAGQVVGQLVSMLPMVIASPGFTVAQTQLATAEDLVQKGVDSTKAQAVGATQALGLGLGIWMPVLGNNLLQRVALGGAGFNAAQGIATRGVSGAILDGTPASEEFKAFDATALTLDVLLGAAFGGLTHLSPSQRTQGAETWNRIKDWAQKLNPSDVEAIATLRQAEHLNVDSIPGKPVDTQDIDAHVQRMRTAIDQLANDKPVDVSDLPEPRVEPDGRFEDSGKRVNEMTKEIERIRKEEGIPNEEAYASQRTEEPLAKSAEPPLDADQPARSSDLVAAAAKQFADENPDVNIHVGREVDGSPITKNVREYLDDVKTEAEMAQQDARLFAAAAQCLMGIF